MTVSLIKTINPAIHERITAAADTLIAGGIENPTNEQVRMCMGGGSLSHISPVMREWREQKKAEAVASLEMPVALKVAIEASLSKVWITASQMAFTAVECAEQKAQIKIDDVTRERNEALSEIADLEAKLSRAEKSLTDHECNGRQLQVALEAERIQGAKLAAENTSLTSLIENKSEQINGLKAAVTMAKDDNRRMQEELIDIAKRQKAPLSKPKITEKNQL